ncbi:hypothetical protein EZS27_022073 [termite gut metagenome]|uniref:Uncharacterized protein n=1 Tax=termite gut metagenome TaxID=433724 RepID=A0A5J4R7M7_9ZZZZ
MNNFIANYRKIVETLRTIEPKKTSYIKFVNPSQSDIELIGIDFTAEYMSIDSEYELFRV